MPEYTIPINFWGTITAKDAEEAFGKAYDLAGEACGEFETKLTQLGFIDVDHLHEEPEEN